MTDASFRANARLRALKHRDQALAILDDLPVADEDKDAVRKRIRDMWREIDEALRAPKEGP